MTILGAIFKEQESWIACDDVSTRGGRNTAYGKPQKWIVSQNWAIAIAGPVRLLNLVEALKEARDIHGFCSNLRDAVEENGFEPERDEGRPFFYNFGLLALHKGHGLYSVSGDFGFRKVTAGEAFFEGSAEDFAFGAEFVVRNLPPQNRLYLALDAACNLSAHAGGPAHVGRLIDEKPYVHWLSQDELRADSRELGAA